MSQQPGWYDDPRESDLLRYWDGVQWTNHTSPRRRPNLDRTSQNIADDGGAYGSGEGGQGYGGQQYGGQQYGGQPYGAQQGGGQHGGGPGYGAQSGYHPMPGGGFEASDPAVQTPDGQPISGWWRRFFARVLDYLLVSILSLALIPLVAPDLVDSFRQVIDLATAAGSTADQVTEASNDFVAEAGRFGLASAVLSVVYEALFLKFLSGTPGKLVLGLRVRLRDESGPLSWSTSIIRALIWHGPTFLGAVPLLGVIANLFPLVNGLWPLWDQQKQSLNDKGAKTNVVRR
ncbi:MAG: RDD family protein [Ornithinimicrobium sp.]